MRANRILAICAVVGATACAHDGHPRERASVSEVTNKMASRDMNEEGKRREHYYEVSKNDALGRGNEANSQLAEGPAMKTTAGSAGADTSGSCELDVYFDSDSAKLGAASQERLDRVADCIKRKQVDHATIVGQTDPTGSKEHNDKLGLERARVVAEYLKTRGVPEGDIRVRSKGELASAQSRDLWPVERNAGVSTH
ncbi:MAG: OmpA/MotB domain protein [Myxococcaceae bacterium]|nr:OmpA/MotB domain protein [Myxococcaceae bacterium]